MWFHISSDAVCVGRRLDSLVLTHSCGRMKCTDLKPTWKTMTTFTIAQSRLLLSISLSSSFHCHSQCYAHYLTLFFPYCILFFCTVLLSLPLTEWPCRTDSNYSLQLRKWFNAVYTVTAVVTQFSGLMGGQILLNVKDTQPLAESKQAVKCSHMSIDSFACICLLQKAI